MAKGYWEIEPPSTAPQTSSESFLGSLPRHAARLASRGVEAVGGLPRGISDALGFLGDIVLPESLQQKNLEQQINTSNAGKFFMNAPGLPSEEDIKSGIQQTVGKALPEGYLEPQSETEADIDYYFKEALPLFLFSGGAKIPRLGKTLAAVGLGNVAKWGAKEVGVGPFGQEVIKMGTMAAPFLLGGRRNLTRMKDEAYKKADQMIPKDAKVIKSGLSKELINQELLATRSASKDANIVKEQLKKINAMVFKDSMKMEDVLHAKRALNESFPTLTKESKRIVGKTINIMKDMIDRGATLNPAFKQNFALAEDLHRGLKSSESLTTILKNATGSKSFKHPFSRWIIEGGPLASVAYSALKGSVPTKTLIGIGAKEGIKFLTFLKKSPAARNYYLKAAQAGLKGNVRGAVNAMKQFDKVAQKNEGQWELEE